MQTQVLGLSVDSRPSLKAWADSLGGITYPLLSDFYPHGQVAQAYDVLRAEGYAERAIYVIDKRGIIRYIDVHDIDEQPDNEVLFDVLADLEPEAAAKYKEELTPEEPEPLADVVMYCTPWCMDCRQARAYLKEQGISYLEVDISKNRGAARRVRRWANGFEKTPTFKIKGEVIVDFDRPRVEAALGIHR